MRRAGLITVSLSAAIAVLTLAVSISAQDKNRDKYAVKVPGGLGFAEFRGYEDWAVISFSVSVPRAHRR